MAEHADDPKVKIVEVDVEPAKGYEVGHVRNAIGWNWTRDLNDTTIRDLINPQEFARWCSEGRHPAGRHGRLRRRHENWFAAWAFWQFKYHGHKDVKLMNGGRVKWEKQGRPWTTDKPPIGKSNYPAPISDESVRSYRDEVLKAPRGRGSSR